MVWTQRNQHPADVSCPKEQNGFSIDNYTTISLGQHDGDVNLSGVCCLLKPKVEIKGMGQSFPCGGFQGPVVIITLDLLVQPV